MDYHGVLTGTHVFLWNPNVEENDENDENDEYDENDENDEN